MSKIFEINEDYSSQRDCLELALEYKNSLTFNIDSVKHEFKAVNTKLNVK